MPNSTDMNRYKVNVPYLNLRSTPVSGSNTNKVAVLHGGQFLIKLDDSPNPDYWKVQTKMDGHTLVGYTMHQHIKKVAEHETIVHSSIVPVHMQEGRSDIKRNRAGGRAYPLGEANMPRRKSASANDQKAELAKIITYLGVESNARYQRTSSSTYCNIYAYDYSYLAGVFLPRVWWNTKAILDLTAGKNVEAQYNKTVMELSANRLYDWFTEFSDDFGWKRVFDYTALQEVVNRGGVGTIVAKHINPQRSGHITMVVPENGAHVAKRAPNGDISVPLQSQAGASNRAYFNYSWEKKNHYSGFGYWVHE